MDKIHFYLSHSSWQNEVNRYIQSRETLEQKESDDEDVELEEVVVEAKIDDANKSKYVTSSYGFGVEHRFVFRALVIYKIDAFTC